MKRIHRPAMAKIISVALSVAAVASAMASGSKPPMDDATEASFDSSALLPRGHSGSTYTSQSGGGNFSGGHSSDSTAANRGWPSGRHSADARAALRDSSGRLANEDHPSYVKRIQSSYAYQFHSRNLSQSCPYLGEMAALLRHPQSVASCDGGAPFNPAVLEEIAKVPPGGGYNVNGSPVNVPIMAGSAQVNRPGNSSYCSGATYMIFMRTVARVDPSTFRKMDARQIQNFDTARNDNYGFYGAWNNNYHGATDANRLIRFGDREPDLAHACPGDFLNFDHKSNGHSTIFLGEREGKVYYWSSNANTNGYGLRCEPAANLLNRNIVRLKHPNNLANIEPYSKQSYKQYYKHDLDVPGNQGFYVDRTPASLTDADGRHI